MNTPTFADKTIWTGGNLNIVRDTAHVFLACEYNLAFMEKIPTAR